MLDEDEALANNNNSLCSICGGDNEAAFIFFTLSTDGRTGTLQEKKHLFGSTQVLIQSKVKS